MVSLVNLNSLQKNGVTGLITGQLITTLRTVKKSSKLLRMGKKKKFGLAIIFLITNGNLLEQKKLLGAGSSKI